MKTRSIVKYSFAAVALFFFICGIWEANKPQVYAPQPIQTQQALTPVTSEAVPYYPQIGDTVILKFGVKSAHLGRTKQAMSDLTKYIMAKDEVGIDELFNTGRAFSVPNGTRARYIQTAGFGVSEVRILDGEYSGISGFVVKEACTK